MNHRPHRLVPFLAAVLAGMALPAIGAVCVEGVSAGIGGSGLFGGPRTVMDLPKGKEMGVITCQEGNIRQVLAASNAVAFVCE